MRSEHSDVPHLNELDLEDLAKNIDSFLDAPSSEERPAFPSLDEFYFETLEKNIDRFLDAPSLEKNNITLNNPLNPATLEACHETIYDYENKQALITGEILEIKLHLDSQKKQFRQKSIPNNVAERSLYEFASKNEKIKSLNIDPLLLVLLTKNYSNSCSCRNSPFSKSDFIEFITLNVTNSSELQKLQLFKMQLEAMGKMEQTISALGIELKNTGNILVRLNEKLHFFEIEKNKKEASWKKRSNPCARKTKEELGLGHHQQLPQKKQEAEVITLEQNINHYVDNSLTTSLNPNPINLKTCSQNISAYEVKQKLIVEEIKEIHLTLTSQEKQFKRETWQLIKKYKIPCPIAVRCSAPRLLDFINLKITDSTESQTRALFNMQHEAMGKLQQKISSLGLELKNIKSVLVELNEKQHFFKKEEKETLETTLRLKYALITAHNLDMKLIRKEQEQNEVNEPDKKKQRIEIVQADRFFQLPSEISSQPSNQGLKKINKP